MSPLDWTIKKTKIHILFLVLFIFLLGSLVLISLGIFTKSTIKKSTSLSASFHQASQEFHVPEAMLETICYMEGDMSTHNGNPSIDNGYGCMHLVKNDRADTLDEAASLLHVSTDQLKTDMATNIRGGAAVLHKEALLVSKKKNVPQSLTDWYGAVAGYSHARTKASAEMYADAIYGTITKGFHASSDTGEIITLAPDPVKPNKATEDHLVFTHPFPQGCADDGKTDYPGAIDCMLDPSKYNCNFITDNSPCTYEEANRPSDYHITFVAIHYFEAYLATAIALFHEPHSLVSIHYIVDTDGTVYQLVPEKDIAYHLGNYWYNQRSIGIEHTGFGPNGFTWYSAAEYLGSAKLTAYLAKKYDVPLDHDHIVSHGTVPADTLDSSPNHVDPGPYWQWDQYFDFIHQQGVAYPKGQDMNSIVSIHPQNSSLFFSPNGTKISDNDNFFTLYAGPGTRYPIIPSDTLVTNKGDETDTIESDLSYVYVNKIIDPAGSGDELYHIWYGENDAITQRDRLFTITGASENIIEPSQWFAHAKLVWLAVPESAVREGKGTIVKMKGSGLSNLAIYGNPISNNNYIIGSAPKGALFVSAFTETENDSSLLWYEINFNHRQAWIPAYEVAVL